MGEFKYVPKTVGNRVPLDQVTTSDKEIDQIRAQMTTPAEDERIRGESAQRESDQQALWKKQAQKAQSQSKEESRKVQNELYVDQLKENGISQLFELGLVIKKISPFLITQPVEWRREYAKESAECLQAKNFFDGYTDLSDKEMEVFKMLKNDTDVNTIVKKIFSSETEQDDFIKKSIRVDHKTEYTMCLNDLLDGVE